MGADDHDLAHEARFVRMKQCRAVVTGRVQGVGFRFFAQREATRLGLSGWVRNLDAGGVEIVVAGPAEQVGRMLERVQEGPPVAWVQRVAVEWQPVDRSLRSFTIKPTSW